MNVPPAHAHTYEPGDWYGVVGSRVVVLLPPEEKARVAGIWAMADDGAEFAEVLDALVAGGLRALPGFVLVGSPDDAGDGGTQVVLRGAAAATFVAGGEIVELDGSQAITWVERTLTDVEHMVLEVGVVADDAPVHSLGRGLVRVARLTYGTPPAASEPEAEGAGRGQEAVPLPEPDPVVDLPATASVLGAPDGSEEQVDEDPVDVTEPDIGEPLALAGDVDEAAEPEVLDADDLDDLDDLDGLDGLDGLDDAAEAEPEPDPEPEPEPIFESELDAEPVELDVSDVDTGTDVSDVDTGTDVSDVDTGTDVSDVDLGTDVSDVDTGTDVSDVDTGTDVSDVDTGTDVSDVDTGTDVSDVDTGTDVSDVDSGTDVSDLDAYEDAGLGAGPVPPEVVESSELDPWIDPAPEAVEPPAETPVAEAPGPSGASATTSSFEDSFDVDPAPVDPLPEPDGGLWSPTPVEPAVADAFSSGGPVGQPDVSTEPGPLDPLTPPAPPSPPPPAPPAPEPDLLDEIDELDDAPTETFAAAVPSDHDGQTILSPFDEDEFELARPGLTGQPPAPPVTARPVARLVFSTGEVYEVDRAIVIGRSPAARRSTAVDPLLVSVPSPHQEISSTHAEVRPGSGADHGLAVITDLGSTNGTIVAQPGLEPDELQAGVAVQLVPGAVIDLGDGVTIQVTRP